MTFSYPFTYDYQPYIEADICIDNYQFDKLITLIYKKMNDFLCRIRDTAVIFDFSVQTSVEG